jgi:hypothetical protein
MTSQFTRLEERISGNSSRNGADLISLSFNGPISSVVRARIAYAFRVFAAIFNYQVIESDGGEAHVRCVYGEAPAVHPDSRVFHIPGRYRVRAAEESAPSFVNCRYAGEEFHLTHGLDSSGKPDWLGEIFEWLSSSYERAAKERDSVGRVPYSSTIFHNRGISARKPHAALLMAWLENALRNGTAKESLPKAPSPDPEHSHLVISTHDIDFYAGKRADTFVRLVKNVVVACHPYRSFSYFRDNASMLFRALAGKSVGAYVPELTESISNRGFRSTFFVVPRRADRRDPNYAIEQIAPALQQAMHKDFSVGLHSSYRSVVEDASLLQETALLGTHIGKKPIGNRQHWLRFDSYEKLFEQVARSGLLFDSSLGFTDTIGFRNGASFAFPPYNFKLEQPYSFLEIPLVLMDGGLEAEARAHRRNPQALAEEVLRESRKWGWGGASLLWHNPIEALSVPQEINSVFWKCANARHDFQEAWLSADQFLRSSLGRYQQAGLLTGAALPE